MNKTRLALTIVMVAGLAACGTTHTVAPVGARHQVLQLIERVGQDEWTTATLEDCHFVPLRPGTAG